MFNIHSGSVHACFSINCSLNIHLVLFVHYTCTINVLSLYIYICNTHVIFTQYKHSTRTVSSVHTHYSMFVQYKYRTVRSVHIHDSMFVQYICTICSCSTRAFTSWATPWHFITNIRIRCVVTLWSWTGTAYHSVSLPLQLTSPLHPLNDLRFSQSASAHKTHLLRKAHGLFKHCSIVNKGRHVVYADCLSGWG